MYKDSTPATEQTMNDTETSTRIDLGINARLDKANDKRNKTCEVRRVFCTYEDRSSCIPGIELLAASLLQHYPSEQVYLFTTSPSTFQNTGRTLTNLKILGIELPQGVFGYSAKPFVLLRALDFASEAIWIDTDIILTGIITSLDGSLPASLIVAAEEPYCESNIMIDRASPWGLAKYRTLPNTLNTCILRVTKYHENLIKHWSVLLTSDHYIHCQSLHWSIRPRHAFGDQDVLEALLTSSEYSQIPVMLLKCGQDIAQCFFEDGYTFYQRIRTALKLPPIVHAQGQKPWLKADKHRPLYLDVSPYNFAARTYKEHLSSDSRWMYPHTFLGKVAEIVTFHNPSLPGAPIALIKEVSRKLALRTRAKQAINKIARMIH